MLWILGLMLIPVIVSVTALVKGRGKISLREFVAMIGASLVIACLVVWLGLRYQTGSEEMWNGRITVRDHRGISCCHCHTEYRPCTGSDGKPTTCPHRVCDHMYGSDREWYATTSNGEEAYNSGCLRSGEGPTERWQQIRVGEPTAIAHRYTSYIRGNPGSILHVRGIAARFAGRLPAHPETYDHYRARRLINQGLPLAPGEEDRLNALLDELNADLGAARQVNVIVILTRERDPLFLEALREAWVGGEKNEFIVVIATPDYPAVAWSGVVSWTRQERLKIRVRDRLNGLGTFDGAQALHIIRNEVDNGFVRRPMADFEYLYATISPPTWILVLGGILEILVNALLARWFWHEDPFENGFRAGFGHRRRDRLIGRRLY